MTEIIRRKLSDSAGARWVALLIVSVTMMMGYFFTDVASPLSTILKTSVEDGGLGWTSVEYGFFAGSYSLINIFLLMLFFGGIILDKMGIRFTGVMSTFLMFAGAAIKFYAVEYLTSSGTTDLGFTLFGLIPEHCNTQVLVASLGFAVFGVGCEIAGITVSKVITKWFTGHELALAMGLQVGLARLGTAGALSVSPIVADHWRLSSPILFGAVALLIGLVAFIVYVVMDKKLDASIIAVEGEKKVDDASDDNFKFSDLKVIFSSYGFWLIALLCLMFYAAVFPFLKFASDLMVNKYGVDPTLAGIIPSILPYGTILLTPIFGIVYDHIGKGATLMLLGSTLLTVCHICFALPMLNTVWFAIVVMIMLGIAFSLVPSAMWPSVPKIIPMKQLGSAYAIIFFIQNIGLMLVPMLMGQVIEDCTLPDGSINFTTPMYIFALFGISAILLSFLLIIADKKRGYGLQQRNIKK